MSDLSRLDALLERWELLGAQGEDVAAEELCRDCPELLEPLRRLIDGLRAMRGMTLFGDREDSGLVTRLGPGFLPVTKPGEEAAALAIEGFVTSLVASGLLSAADVREFQAQLAPEEPRGDARQL